MQVKRTGCTVEKCPNPHLARGWCRKHYKAWQAHGDPLGPPVQDRYRPGEEWRTVPGWEGLYEVSSFGRVWSIRSRRLLTPNINRFGYPAVALCWNRTSATGKQVSIPIHRIEAAAFLGLRPKGQGVRHLDGNHTNNVLSNLAYGTQKQNMHDAIDHGTHAGPRRAAEVAQRPTCINGHEYVAGSFYANAAGSKVCRKCDTEKAARYRERKALRK